MEQTPDGEQATSAVEHRPLAVADQLPAWVPSALKYPDKPRQALLVAPALTLTGALALSALAAWLIPNLERPAFPALPWYWQLFSLVIFAPVAETFIMAGLLGLARRWLGVVPSIIFSAAVWGAAHSFAAAAWGLIVWWPFVIFSLVYLVWRQKGFWTGIAMAASAHLLHNLMPAIFQIVQQANQA